MNYLQIPLNKKNPQFLEEFNYFLFLPELNLKRSTGLAGCCFLVEG